MTQSAHTFTPQDDSLTERMSAYHRVQRDYDSLRDNIENLDTDALGEQEDVSEAQKILANSLNKAFESIDESELQDAVKQGLLSKDEVVSFMQSKQELEMASLRESKLGTSHSKSHRQSQE